MMMSQAIRQKHLAGIPPALINEITLSDIPSASTLISTKSNNLYFHPLEIVSCYRDPQLQVREND